jgi:hypothetical protein
LADDGWKYISLQHFSRANVLAYTYVGIERVCHGVELHGVNSTEPAVLTRFVQCVCLQCQAVCKVLQVIGMIDFRVEEWKNLIWIFAKNVAELEAQYTVVLGYQYRTIRVGAPAAPERG